MSRTLDFMSYRQEQKDADAAYERELRNRDPSTLTGEEIMYLVKKNETFRGTRINEERLERYEKLKCVCADFLGTLPAAHRLTERPPCNTCPNASLYLDLDSVISVSRQSYALYRQMVNLADRMVLVVTDTGGVRMTFNVLGIWEK